MFRPIFDEMIRKREVTEVYQNIIELLISCCDPHINIQLLNFVTFDL